MDGFYTRCKIVRGVTWGSLRMGLKFRAVSSPKVGSIITNLQDACEDPLPTLSYESCGYKGDNIGLVGSFTLGQN